VTGAGGGLVGLLTRAELLNLERLPQPEAPALAWRALLMQPVSAVMLSPVPAVGEDTDLRRVARVLLDTHLPGLPVVAEDGQVTGFISRSDILRAVVHDPPLDLWS
jgi:CBS domain-containing protein